MIYNAIKRSAQSVLHSTNLPREEANRIGEQIANTLSIQTNYHQACIRYNANDEFEVGELAAKEFIKWKLS